MTTEKTKAQSIFPIPISRFVGAAARRAITKARDFVLIPVRQAWTVAPWIKSKVTIWATTHQKLILWITIASAIVLGAGIVLAYLYFTRPGFRSFILGIGSAVRTRSSFRPPKPATAQIPIPVDVQTEEVPARQSANTTAPAM
jgi:hypothetical protein